MNKLPRNRSNFNCMSYALDDYTGWLMPGFVSVMHPSRITRESFKDFVKTLENRHGLKKIDSPSQVDYSTNVIAFRIAPYSDFHFIVRKGKNWFHKRGAAHRIERIKKEEVFSESWCNRYNGEIAFFIKK